jgi:hypothetical protein
MATIGLYISRASQEEANALRSRLNGVAGELGYKATRGPTAGEGNLSDMLKGIDLGEVGLVELDYDTDWGQVIQRLESGGAGERKIAASLRKALERRPDA